MKRSFGILASAIAVVAILGACQKEQVNSQDNGSEQKVAELFGTFTVKADYTDASKPHRTEHIWAMVTSPQHSISPLVELTQQAKNIATLQSTPMVL